MGKKKHKHANQAAGWGQAGFGSGMGAGMGAGMGMAGMDPTNMNPGAPPGMGYGVPGMDGSFLHNLQGLVGSRHTEQFIVGALLGAAAVYVLGDEEMRAKLMKGMMKLYAGIAGGFEEMKEQMADLKAEVAAEKRSGG